MLKQIENHTNTSRTSAPGVLLNKTNFRVGQGIQLSVLTSFKENVRPASLLNYYSQVGSALQRHPSEENLELSYATRALYSVCCVRVFTETFL